MTRDYSDIIDLPRPVSKRHAPMPMEHRAAQFSPFAALTGFDATIREVARLTERRIELSESEQAELNARLLALSRRLPAEAALTWFVPDAAKDGGRYVTQAVTVRRVNQAEGRLELADGRRVDFDCVLDIEAR